MRDNLVSLTTNEQAIAKSFGHTLEMAVKKYGYNLEDFVRKTIQTEIFKDFFEDFTLYIQEGTYIVAKITDELNAKGIQIQPADSFEYEHFLVYAEIGFWIGYLLICWRCRDHVSPEELLQFDYEEIIWSYEVLHTQSVEYAIDAIKTEYRLSI